MGPFFVSSLWSCWQHQAKTTALWSTIFHVQLPLQRGCNPTGDIKAQSAAPIIMAAKPFKLSKNTLAVIFPNARALIDNTQNGHVTGSLNLHHNR